MSKTQELIDALVKFRDERDRTQETPRLMTRSTLTAHLILHRQS